MFYLDEDVPLVHGHAIYIDSEWALTSISQRQFWRGFDFAQTGDGRVEGVLSVDVSDWSTPSRRLGKVAMQCTHDEVLEEVWAQLTDHVEDLDKDNVAARLPRPGDRVPEPDAGRQPRAAAGQHRRLVGGPTGRGDADPQPVPRLRLRAHPHRPGDDGGRQRGGAARRQRHPRGDRLERAAVRDLAAARARRCSRPPRRSTSCAGSSSTARPSRRCGSPESGELEPTGPLAAGLVRLGPLLRRLRG